MRIQVGINIAGADFQEQREFSIQDGIKPSEIVGVHKKQGGKTIGNFFA